MFTGIISDIGEIVGVEARGDTRFRVATSYAPAGIAIGASIACSGCCLTVIETGHTMDGRGYFDVEVSAETLSKTTLGSWKSGSRINLERAVKVGDELGGHIVSGHVDGVGRISRIVPEGDSLRFTFTVPTGIAPYIASKGSVAVDGTSLTVNEVEGDIFGVNIIPHTRNATTWGRAAVGDAVNIEIDMLARYVARLTEFQTK